MKIFQTWIHERYKELLDRDAIRPGCEPKILIHDRDTQGTNHSIVLVHGLTDSPYFMEAVGIKFFEMGFNVLIPLLPGHGLREPQGMKSANLKSWQEEVDFAVQFAHIKGQKVSIGGLSTGGTLSVWKAMTDTDEINGGVFLFSAALDLAGSAGDFLEKLLRTRLIRPLVADIQDLTDKPLVGNGLDDNPYRYSRMDFDGAAPLSKLIQQIENIVKNNQKLTQPVFVAHSEDDQTADINEVIKYLIHHKDSGRKTELFRIGKNFHVPHASVVLAKNVTSINGSPLEPKNPFFNEMMDCAKKFYQKHIEG